MSYTQIMAQVVDQTLTLTNTPTVASGGVNEVQIRFSFCPLWDGFAKTAVFFNTEDGPVYEMVLANGVCVVPHEALADAGDLFIGVRGVAEDDSDTVRTTVLVRYDVKNGAPAGNAETVEPTADVYQQLLKIAGETQDIAQSVRDDFDAGAIPALQEQNTKAGFRFWVGTTAEYEAQKSTLPAGTFCVLTDDTTTSQILTDLATLKADVEAMKGVDLGTMPFQVDIMQFDYFVVFGSTGERVGGIFDVQSRDTSALEMRARWYGGFNDAITAGTYQTYADLSFYWGDGGYMMDATARLSNGAIGLLTYSKIYGFKYPV